MNRAVARRTLFETEDDIRFFLSRLARSVRLGQLEVHAFSVMTTHFHLLVRSPGGELSVALQRIQNEYVRRFNRRRRRDGSLVRGRFRSRPVTSIRYRKTLVRYTDDNPVSAGLVATPGAYPHGSARHYLRPSGPPWLSRSWVESVLRELDSAADAPTSSYLRAFGGPLAPSSKCLVERRLRAGASADDPLDELLQAATPSVRAWMRQKAEMADGTEPGIPLVAPEVVQDQLDAEKLLWGPWSVRAGRSSADGWLLARVGLLRELCATTYEEAARRTTGTTQNAWTLHKRHRRLLLDDEEYSLRIAELAKAILTASWGESVRASR
jgi:REP element-mobilizing transposase RayT